MSRTPAKTTQADVRRVLRAAKQERATYVDVLPDGTIRIALHGEKPEGTDPQAVDDGKGLVF
ncbi:MAG: hypothetical protein JO314_00145 [Acidobacteria bacterium]|nr:hypothetical protein [Acidobacteriota bacterium]